ncbi:Uncharacterised protein [Mycobacteroides abscessus subsp. abscessus]|nr:Uncharacterised protein [Mycobacteroides abscessus subsp. abscessus]DAZ89962.1 TPA_asm: membrane protein [Mycobacterium phage prophiFSAT01-1]
MNRLAWTALFGAGLASIAALTAGLTFIVLTRLYSPGEKDPRLVEGKNGW